MSFTVTVRSTREKQDRTVAESRVTTVTHAWNRSVDQTDTLRRNKILRQTAGICQESGVLLTIHSGCTDG